MQFVLKIKLGNAAMSSFDDIACALSEVARKLPELTEVEGSDSYDRRGRIRDDNGNAVGQWDIK